MLYRFIPFRNLPLNCRIIVTAPKEKVTEPKNVDEHESVLAYYLVIST
jgi:hypothetical protein